MLNVTTSQILGSTHPSFLGIRGSAFFSESHVVLFGDHRLPNCSNLLNPALDGGLLLANFRPTPGERPDTSTCSPGSPRHILVRVQFGHCPWDIFEHAPFPSSLAVLSCREKVFMWSCSTISDFSPGHFPFPPMPFPRQPDPLPNRPRLFLHSGMPLVTR